MRQKGKRVLIVDDEQTLLHTFSNSLKAYASDLEVLTAENGSQAVGILNGTPVDLVVTDLKMPEMDGFELIIYMKKHFPGVPVIVMTAAGSPEVADQIRSLGALSYLDKPINIKELALRIFQGIAAASQGRISGVTLAGFLQLIVMEKKTCALKVKSGDKSGILLIKDGDLIDAKAENLSGEAAVCDIVTWGDTEIKMGNYTGERTKKIDAALGEILIDAFRMKDERERTARSAAAPDGGIGADAASPAVDGAPQERKVVPAAGAGGDASAAAPEDRRGDLNSLLSRLSKMQGVDAVSLVGCDGFLLDGVFNTKIEAELLGAIASAAYGASDSIAGELGRGRLESTIFEFEQVAVIIAPVGKKYLLVIMAGKDANLGMLRVKVRKLESELVAAAEAV